jgi:hypothetical protein
MVKGGDLFGDGVNIAARMQTIASAGGVCEVKPPPDLPSRHRAQRSLAHHPATAFAAPWPHPMAPASKRRVLHRSSGSPASPWDESARAIRGRLFDLLHLIGRRMRQRFFMVEHRTEITHIKPTAASFAFVKMFGLGQWRSTNSLAHYPPARDDRRHARDLGHFLASLGLIGMSILS